MTILGYSLDLRLLFYAVWGIGTVLVYGIVLRRRRKRWKRYHDKRARREVVSGLSLFLVGVASLLAITFVLFGEAGTGIRGLFAAGAFGALFANGIVMLTESDRPDDVT